MAERVALCVEEGRRVRVRHRDPGREVHLRVWRASRISGGYGDTHPPVLALVLKHLLPTTIVVTESWLEPATKKPE